MRNFILITLFVIFSLLSNSNIFANDKAAFCRSIKIEQNGKFNIQQPYQLYLGNYLYGIGNKDVYKLRLREGIVYEYLFQGVLVQIKYNDQGSVFKVREKKKGFPELFHEYRYNDKALIERIDHARITLSKDGQFTRESLGASYYHYDDKGQLEKIEKKNNKGNSYYISTFSYNDGVKSNYKVKINDELRKSIQYINKDGLKIEEKHFYKGKYLYSYKFDYDEKKNLKSIEKQIKGISYFKDKSKRETLVLKPDDDVVEMKYEINNLNEIHRVKGILPNIQSYINFTFSIKPHPLVGNKDAIFAEFSCILVKDNAVINRVASAMVPSGKRIETRWYNQKGEDVYQQLPEELRHSRRFSFVNLLSIQNVIFGKISDHTNRPIDREVIVEIYDLNMKRDWCFIHKGYYFYLTDFYDEKRDFNKIKILKAGYLYENKDIKIDSNKTVNGIEATKLKLADSIKP